MAFNPSGQLIALRKYSDSGVSRTIGSFDSRSVWVYLAIDSRNEFITDIWIRYYGEVQHWRDLGVMVSSWFIKEDYNLIIQRFAPAGIVPAVLDLTSDRTTVSLTSD